MVYPRNCHISSLASFGHLQVLDQTDFRQLQGAARARPLPPRTGNPGLAGVDGDSHPLGPKTVPQVLGVVRPRDSPARTRRRRLGALQWWLAAGARGATAHTALNKGLHSYMQSLSY